MKKKYKKVINYPKRNEFIKKKDKILKVTIVHEVILYTGKIEDSDINNLCKKLKGDGPYSLSYVLGVLDLAYDADTAYDLVIEQPVKQITMEEI